MKLIDPNDKNKNENVLAYNMTMMTISLTIVFLISFVIILVTLAGNIYHGAEIQKTFYFLQVFSI